MQEPSRQPPYDLVAKFGDWVRPYEPALRAILCSYKEQDTEISVKAKRRDEAIASFRMLNPTAPVFDSSVYHALRCRSLHFAEHCVEIEARVTKDPIVSYTLAVGGCALYDHCALEHTDAQQRELERILARLRAKLAVQQVGEYQRGVLLELLSDYLVHRVEVLSPEVLE